MAEGNIEVAGRFPTNVAFDPSDMDAQTSSPSASAQPESSVSRKPDAAKQEESSLKAVLVATQDELKQSQENLQRTNQQLEASRAHISKLEGLIGSLKSGILHLSPEEGQQFLLGEIAAMETVVFGLPPSRRQRKSKKLNSPKRRSTSSSSRSKAKSSNLEEEPEFCTLEESSVSTGNSERSCNIPREVSGTSPCIEEDASTLGSDGSSQSSSSSSSSDGVGVGDKAHQLRKLSKLRGAKKQPKNHPRVMGPSYWKEFSSQTFPSHQQRQGKLLEAAIRKQKRPAWGSSLMPSFLAQQ